MTDAADGALVLVADDERDIVELVAFVLGRAGYEVVTAADGGAGARARSASGARRSASSTG